MKRVFYFAAAALAACAMMVSCEKDNGDDGKGNGGGTTRLAVPQPSVIDTTDNGIVVGWSAIANAATYDVVLNDDEDNIISVTENQYEVLTPTGGTYRVRVRSVPAEGSEYSASQWSTTVEFTVRASSGEVPAEYQPWVGFWTVNSTQTQIWGPDPTDPEYVAASIEDTPRTETVEFYYVTDYLVDNNGNPVGCLLMEGWASDAEAKVGAPLPIVCMLGENGGLDLWTGFTLAEQDGVSIAPYGLCKLDDGTFTVVSGQYPAYTMTLNGDNATAAAYVGTLANDQGGFTVMALDIYGLASAGGVYIYSEGAMAGDITMTKSASQSAVRFACSLNELESFSAKAFGVTTAVAAE